MQEESAENGLGQKSFWDKTDFWDKADYRWVDLMAANSDQGQNKLEPGRFFYFSYHLAPKRDREQHPHELRDGGAFARIACTLTERGWRYSGVFFNYPAEPQAKAIHVDSGFLGPRDLLVLATRPPLDDRKAGDKKQVYRSRTDLEDRVLARCRHFFSACARSQVHLAPEIATLLPEKYANRANIEFRRNVDARYSKIKRETDFKWESPPNDRTSAYLILVRDVWDNGPSLLASFAVGGAEALVWSHILCSRFSDRLDSPRFFMVEMDRRVIPKRPENLAFADEWNVQVLIDQPF